MENVFCQRVWCIPYASVRTFLYFDRITANSLVRLSRFLCISTFFKCGLLWSRSIGRSTVLVEVKSVGRSTEKVERMHRLRSIPQNRSLSKDFVPLYKLGWGTHQFDPFCTSTTSGHSTYARGLRLYFDILLNLHLLLVYITYWSRSTGRSTVKRISRSTNMQLMLF